MNRHSFDLDSAPQPGEPPVPSAESPAAARILGIDPGERRIGIAISDELGLTAQPLLTMPHTNHKNDMRRIARLVRRHGCTAIVVGWPIHLSGDRGSRAQAAEKFAAALREHCGVPVHLWDERMSTAEAHRHLDAVGRETRGRKEIIDRVAAVLILQSWLDSHRASPSTSASLEN
jgi:putative Holliday junction resolvase